MFSCVVRKINYERLIKIVIEASEQSNRLSIPKIDNIQKLDDFFKNNKERTENIDSFR